MNERVGDRRRADVMMLGLRSVGGTQGGVEAHVRMLASELVSGGRDVVVLERTPYSRSGESVDVRVKPLWSPRGKSTEALVHSFIGAIYAAFKRPRVLHVHAVGPALSIPLARLFGLRVVFTHHGEDYNREKWGAIARTALRFGELLGARFSHARIAVSASLARRMSDKYGIDFVHIPNGVSVQAPPADGAILDELGLRQGQYVLNVGRLVPEKRQLDLIAAFLRLERPGLKLVIAGGADHASPYAEQVAEAARQSSNVVLAGFVPPSRLRVLYANAAAFVLPSSHEGLPIALLEAMSFGLPVVASDIEANRDVALPTECYFPLGDLSLLETRLKRQLDRPAQPNWSDFLERYQWSRIADSTDAVYSDVMRRRA